MRRDPLWISAPRLHCAEGALLSFHSRVHHRIAGAAFGAGLLASLLPSDAWCWETAHGPPDNTGFVDVITKPAQSAIKTIVDIGTIAPGAGPVVAPDGTVYLGNEQGKLMSFKPDGTPGWSRTIAAGQRIVASPAIGSDGTVYVIGVSVARDHRGGKSVDRVDSYLHVFNSTGGYLGQTVFPDHEGGGGTTTSPNIWRFNGTELVIVPAVYRGSSIKVRLLAFSTSGALVLDQLATTVQPRVVGYSDASSACYVPVAAHFCALMEGVSFPATDGASGRNITVPAFPGVGIFTNPQGGTPFILLSDRMQDLVGFVLSGGAFVETFRLHDDDRYMRSAPAILPDMHSIIGVENFDQDTLLGTGTGGVGFSGPNLNKLGPVGGLPLIFATPTRLADGRSVLIGAGGQMIVLTGMTVDKKIALHSKSFASASASRTHLFVSTEDAIQTFDPATMKELSRMMWSEGGRSQPAIGPTGYVYAVAGSTLYVFPPSLKQLPPNRVQPESAPTAVSTSGADTKPYKPPLTMSGNRLFACEELDGDDCGKGDYQTIATAFCKKEGFIGAGQIKVDSKKVKAETLDGRYCSKNKCKVFEQIICANN
jgi:hypothetical protein